MGTLRRVRGLACAHREIHHSTISSQFDKTKKHKFYFIVQSPFNIVMDALSIAE